MRPALSWSDLPGRRVGIYGLGREGSASLRACQLRGIDPVLVDDSPSAAGVLATADGGAQALAECEVVIASPGISIYGPVVTELQEQGVEIVGGLGLWLADPRDATVIAITGTKGKSTTTAIAAHLATGLGVDARVGGNIGAPPYDPQAVADEPGLWVIEVSSYQAATARTAPPVIGVTSLHPDHLPWHQSDPEVYYRDKLSICRLPGARLTIANGDSDLLRDRRHLLGREVRWIQADDADDPANALWIDELGLLGQHNRRNALIAAALLAAAGVEKAHDTSALAMAAAGFHGLESRLQPVATVGGVQFVDDGLSTNVLGTLAAVEAFEHRRVALIVGGQDRGIDYHPLAVGLRARQAELLVITIPDNGPRIHQELTEAGAGPAVTVEQADDLTPAVERGFQWAGPGGVVLLSPAAPSFGRFIDYRHRGRVFAEAASSLQ